MAQATHPALSVPVSRALLHKGFRFWLPLISLAPFVFWMHSTALIQMLNPLVMALHGFLTLTFKAFPNHVFSIENPVGAAIVDGTVWFLIGFALDELSARLRARVSTIPGFAYVFTLGVMFTLLAIPGRVRYELYLLDQVNRGGYELVIPHIFALQAGVWGLLALNGGLWGVVVTGLLVYWKHSWVHIPRTRLTAPGKRGSKGLRSAFVPKWLLTIPLAIFLVQGAWGIFVRSSGDENGFAVVYTLLVLTALHFRWLFPDAPSHPFAIQTWKQAMRQWRKWTWIAVAAVTWIGAALLANGHFEYLPLMITLFLVLAYTRWVMPDLKEYAWAIWAGIAFGLALSITGSYHALLDAALFAAAGMAGYVYWFNSRSKYRQLISGVAFFTAAWLLCSLGDILVRQAPAVLNPGRFRSLRQQPVFHGKQVGVALSGGGIRAALVHAGALHVFEDLGIPVTHIAGVSGGSIIASYYALGGPPSEFEQAVSDHKFHLYRDLFDLQNLGRIVFSGRLVGTDVRMFPWRSFTRTDVEAAALDRVLLRSRTLKSLSADTPKLLIGTTDLATGRAVGFTSQWVSSRFLLHPPGEKIFPNALELYESTYRFQNLFTRVPLDRDIALSSLVSASSAFPLALAPVKVKLNQTLIFSGQKTLVLADGGVTDNSGMTLLLDADWRANRLSALDMDREWRLDAAIAIDGGAMFTPQVEEQPSYVSRAMDIVDSRVGAILPTGLDPSVKPEKLAKRVLLSPSAYLDNSVLLRSDIRLKFGRYGYLNEEKQYFRAVVRQLSKLDRDGLVQMVKLHPTLFDSQMRRFATEIVGQYRSGDDLAGHGPWPQGELRRMMRNLAWRFQTVLGDEIQSFLKTPTLKDNLDQATTDRLYALGEDLAVLNEPDIRAALLGPGAANWHLLNEVERQMFLCEMNGEMDNLFRVREPEQDPRESREETNIRDAAYERMLVETVQGCSRPEIEKGMKAPTEQKAKTK